MDGEAGGVRGHRSIAGIGREKNPKASLRQEASRRSPGENPTACPNAPREVKFAVGKEKPPAHAARASLALPASPHDSFPFS